MRQMMNRVLMPATLAAAALLPRLAHAQDAAPDANVVYLAGMKPVAVNSEQQDRDWMKDNWKSGDALIGGRKFNKSISWHTHNGFDDQRYGGEAVFLLKREFDWFEADVGISDDFPNANEKFRFTVMGDNKILLASEEMSAGDEPFHIRVSVKNMARLQLRFSNSYLHAGWAWWGDAKLIKGNAPIATAAAPGSAARPTETYGTKVLRIEPSSLRELATDFKAQMLNDPDLSKIKPTLAIASFKLIPQNQLAASNGDNVREDLSTALIKTKAFEIVERGQLDKALAELKIGLSDTFDSEKAQKLGKLVSARLVLIGSISDRGTYAVINARLIDTQTGKVNIASSVEARQ